MIGKRLTKLRKDADLTQQQLADKIYISRDTYAQYETDRRSPDYGTLNKIADYFQVSTDYILGRSENPHQEQVLFDSNIIYQQRDEGDAYLTVRELEVRYNLSKETVDKMIDDIHGHYKNQQVIDPEGGILTDGPNSPGSGALPEDKKRK